MSPGFDSRGAFSSPPFSSSNPSAAATATRRLSATRRWGALSLGIYGLSPDQVGHIESGEAGRLGHGDAGVWVVNVSTGELVHHDTLWNSPEALEVCPPAAPDVRAPRLELFNG